MYRRSNPKWRLFLSWGRQLFTFSERQSLRHSHLNYKAKGSCCVGCKRNVQLLSSVQSGDRLCLQQEPFQMQMDAASVKPALTLWQHSGLQSGNTIWDTAFPIQSQENCFTVIHYEYFIFLHKLTSKVQNIPFKNDLLLSCFLV